MGKKDNKGLWSFKKRYSHWFLQYAANPKRIAKTARVTPKPGDFVGQGVGISGEVVVGDIVSDGDDTVVLVGPELEWSGQQSAPGSSRLQGLCGLNSRRFRDQRVHTLVEQPGFFCSRFSPSHHSYRSFYFLTILPVGICSRRIPVTISHVPD